MASDFQATINASLLQNERVIQMPEARSLLAIRNEPILYPDGTDMVYNFAIGAKSGWAMAEWVMTIGSDRPTSTLGW